MPNPLQMVLWLLSVVLQAGVVVSALARKDARRYFPLAIYMLTNVLVSVASYFVISAYGFRSSEYKAFYSYTDSLLVVALFFAILFLCEQVLSDFDASKYVRGGAAFLIVATAAFSYLTVLKNSAQMDSHKLVTELGQNLYFVGVVMVYLLWGVVTQLRETRTRILQFVFSLGIYFSLLAAAYAMINLFPASTPAVRWIPQLASIFLAGSWIHAMVRVAEDARMATAQVVPAQGRGDR